MWMCQSRKGLLLLHDVYAWRNGRIAAWMDVDRWRRWQENRQFPKRGFAVCSPGTLQRCHSYGGFADRCCWPGIWRWKPWGNSVGADFVGDLKQRGTARGTGRCYCGVKLKLLKESEDDMLDHATKCPFLYITCTCVWTIWTCLFSEYPSVIELI